MSFLAEIINIFMKKGRKRSEIKPRMNSKIRWIFNCLHGEKAVEIENEKITIHKEESDDE